MKYFKLILNKENNKSLNDVKCTKCGSLLFKMRLRKSSEDLGIEVKCKKCKKINNI